ncbi:glycosyltransferase [Falsirhodobacter algicola]|uniref:Glycosyltransferase n=1 Tax=Falsirhodobacter algicola TaxID=2692330 RepID=A0A8J8MTR5_9RHOB|nr:glycosyltransferase [Falsirhodobacter algicola]QUS36093.1 glycosyltransferase [Falsirhodobacter algicola]
MTDASLSVAASHYAGAHAADVPIRSEIEKAVAIYERRFPHHAIRFILSQGMDPVYGHPDIIHGPIVLEPHLLSADTFGIIERGSSSPDAPRLTVRLAFPRKATPLERKVSDPDWAPRGKLRHLYRASPMMYERLRHWHERRQEARSTGHSWRSLPFTGFAPDYSAPAPATADGRPAILIAMHWLETGGAEKLAFDCVRWARDLGLRIFVVAGNRSLQRMEGKLGEDVTFLRLDRYLPPHEWPLYLERLIREENIGLIHIHHCTPVYAALAHLRVTTPWVKVIDSTHIIEYADGGFARISGVWSNYIDMHHVISDQLARMYRERFHTGPKIRLGRMLDRAHSVTPATPNMAARQTNLTVTFVGRLYYQKRPITVVLAMKALADWARGAGVVPAFHMVGEGPFGAACLRLINRLGLREMVTLHEAGTDVPALLAKSDIMILPSANEGLALVCYEAIEQGAIPISTRVGAQDEILPDALLVPRDPQQACRGIVAAVRRLWEDQAHLDAQAAQLRDRYAALSADPTAEEVIKDFYQQALAPKEPA